MASLIPHMVKRLWDEWNLRAAVLVSLFLQMVLVSLATFRKRTGNRIVNAIIWSVYLLADWLAAIAVGLISNGQSNDNPDKFSINEDIAAFWAPFLLLHLGGPDNITAFSLEDNELWIRHLLGLVIQLLAVAYVYSQSIPNVLSVPTILLFSAGAIKYAERTRALYLGCLGNLKASMLPRADAGPIYAPLVEEYSSKKVAGVPVRIITEKEPERGSPDWSTVEEITHLEVVQKGYEFFTTFRGLIVDHMFSFDERNKSRNFFSLRSAHDAFRVVEVELNFMYDSLYTKMAVVHGNIGFVFRFICSVLIVLSFVEFASHHSPEINHFDVTVTYILLYGAVGLDLVALIKVIFSDWTVVVLKNRRVKQIVYAVHNKLSSDRRWSNTISQHNLINFCLNQRWIWLDIAAETVGLQAFLDELKYKKDFVIQDKLKEFIFQELKGKASKAETNKVVKEIYSARGQRALSDYIHCRIFEIMSSIGEADYKTLSSSVSEEVDYDESLLLWHIATELCYSTSHDDKNSNREFCKLISDYMLYLLVMRPTMMSAVAGIGQIRFQDTCEEAKKFFRRWKTELRPPISSALGICAKLNIYHTAKNACPARESSSATTRQRYACERLLHVNTVVEPIYVKGDRSKSVLFDACRLAKVLRKLKDDQRWEIMSKVWVELLSYAASHCRPNAHAQELSKGGELITFVWILMAHFGLGEQFRILMAHFGEARAKLIVEKQGL